jgi:hypothetical protein
MLLKQIQERIKIKLAETVSDFTFDNVRSRDVNSTLNEFNASYLKN